MFQHFCEKKILISFMFQIQIFGYNSQLYSNFSDAIFRAQGIVGVSVLLQVNSLKSYYMYFIIL